MLAHSPLFQQALARPHTVVVQVRVTAGSRVLFDELAYRPDGTSVWFGGGSVRIALASRVTRTAKIAVSKQFYPVDPADLFAPFGNELNILRGVRYGNGSTELFDVFTGPITGAAERDDGLVDIAATDRALWPLDAGFVAPWPARADNATNEFKALIRDAAPDAVFAPMETFGQPLPPMSWENDRGKALDDVAKAVGAIWLCDAAGRYLMMQLPWAVPNPEPLRTLTIGKDGTVFKALGARSRDELFNQISAFTERTDGTQPPLRVVVLDNKPDSPTWVGGPFHTKTLHVEATSATSVQQLRNIAAEQLARGLTWTEAFNLRMVPDPTMELGDAYLLAVPSRPSTQIVTAVQMPLDTRSSATVTTRSPAGLVL